MKHVQVVVFASIALAVVSAQSLRLGETTANLLIDAGDTQATQQTPGHDVYHFLQYPVSVLAVFSCLLLVMLQFTPNGSQLASIVSWELVLFVGYIQRMASLSHLVLQRVPNALWAYTDTFSWTAFVPFHGSSVSSSRRGLAISNGIAAFGYRIGVDENDLLVRNVIGLLIISSGVVVVIVREMVKLHLEKRRSSLSLESFDSDLVMWSGQKTPVGLDLAVLLVLFALYPVALLASFEIATQIRVHQLNMPSLTNAILAVVLVCGVGSALCLATMKDTARSRFVFNEERPSRHRPLAAVFVLVHIVTGQWSCAQWRRTGRCANRLDCGLPRALWTWTRNRAIRWLALGLGVTQILNLGLAVAFLHRPEDIALSDKSLNSAASVYIVLNSVVVISFFARHFGLACRRIRAHWDVPQRPREITYPPSDDGS